MGEVMPLTPEDVSNKRFTPVRLREGYDMGEVDQFLDEVEAELERLNKENDDLRQKLEAAQRSGGGVSSAPAPQVVERAPEPTPPPAPAPVVAAPAQEIKVTTVADASSAAAKLLEIATRNADELVGEAKDEADRIVGAARPKAERPETGVRAKSARLGPAPPPRPAMPAPETEARRKEIFGNLEKEKDQLNSEIE